MWITLRDVLWCVVILQVDRASEHKGKEPVPFLFVHTKQGSSIVASYQHSLAPQDIYKGGKGIVNHMTMKDINRQTPLEFRPLPQVRQPSTVFIPDQQGNICSDSHLEHPEKRWPTTFHQRRDIRILLGTWKYWVIGSSLLSSHFCNWNLNWEQHQWTEPPVWALNFILPSKLTNPGFNKFQSQTYLTNKLLTRWCCNKPVIQILENLTGLHSQMDDYNVYTLSKSPRHCCQTKGENHILENLIWTRDICSIHYRYENTNTGSVAHWPWAMPN